MFVTEKHEYNIAKLELIRIIRKKQFQNRQEIS